MKRVFSEVLLVILLVSTLCSALNGVRSDASGTIFIRADGSIEGTENIQSDDNITYVFAADVNDSVTVERDNIVIDGKGFTLRGSGISDSRGIDLSGRTNVTVHNMQITTFYYGIYLGNSTRNRIIENNITANDGNGILLFENSTYNIIRGNRIIENLAGIGLYYSSNNNLSENNVTANRGHGIWLTSSSNTSANVNTIASNVYGIYLTSSNDCSFIGNNITENTYMGASLFECSNNRFYHNNFNNSRQVQLSSYYANIWDHIYPSGGNYWSDYNGEDANNDGIGDTPYIIDADNHDHYPLMHPWSSLPVHNINTGFGYPTIQEAVNASETLGGHTIFVDEGTYHESVFVSKSISIVGEDRNKTIIDGNQLEEGVHVVADNVLLSNLSVRGFREHGLSSAILVEGSHNCSILDTSAINNTNGIFLLYSSNSTLSGNLINNCEFSFGVQGVELADYVHSIDSSNLIDGKPIYYLLNHTGSTINRSTHPNAGYLAIVNSLNVTVEDLELTNNLIGLTCAYTNESAIRGVNITNCIVGLTLPGCRHNIVMENNIVDNGYGYGLSGGGLALSYSADNEITGNHIVGNNYYGIAVDPDSNNNLIHRNCFVDNKFFQAWFLFHNSSNVWDNGVEGNYWSDYNGTDANYDGIGDTPYVVDANNMDNYALMGIFSDFKATSENHVTTISNSSISGFQFNGTAIIFNITGGEGTTGFCRIRIPTSLMNATYRVFVNGTEVTGNLLPCSNSTYGYLYFNYAHSTDQVIIIVEFRSLLIVILFMTITASAVVTYRKKHSERIAWH